MSSSDMQRHFNEMWEAYHKAFPEHADKMAVHPSKLKGNVWEEDEINYVEAGSVMFNPYRLKEEDLLSLVALTLELRQMEWYYQSCKRLDCLIAFGGEVIVI